MDKNKKATIAKALDTLEGITSSLSPDVAAPIRAQLEPARARFEDKYLNLAVIGDFSCGKSTFINALFGRDVLSTDMQPTTAVPTYIRWVNTKPHFTVVAYDMEGRAYRLSKPSDVQKLENLIQKALPENEEQVIDAVTTDDTLCQYLSRIELKAPVRKSMRRICLIDTPGVNPGTSGSESHVRVTQNVLRSAADAAIIMFPADKVFTDSFRSFLEENASHLLDQSIFVITQCDTIPSPQSRERLVDFVRKQLLWMEVPDPIVHCVSAKCALDVYAGLDTSQEAKDFCVQFEQTIDSIFAGLALRRRTIVHNNVCAVLETVSGLLDAQIQDTSRILQASREEMRLYSPENMEKECNLLLQTFRQEAKKIKNRYRSSSTDIVSNAIVKCLGTACSDLNRETTKDGISQYLDRYGTQDLQPVIQAMKTHLSRLSRDLKEKYDAYCGQLAACFQKYQIHISGSGILPAEQMVSSRISLEDVSVKVSGHLTGSDVVTFLGNTVDEILTSDNLLDALVDTALGTVVLAIGVVGAVFNAFRPLESIRSNAIDTISRALDQNRASLCAKLEAGADNCYSAYQNSAQKLPGQWKEKYHQEYTAAMNGYYQTWSHIEAQIALQSEHLAALQALSQELGF